MDRRFQNYIIDMVMLITGIMTGVTGIIKWPGLVHTLSLSYRGLPMKAITTIHDWAGIATCTLAAIHILLHWKWLAEMTKSALKMKGNKN
jgi:hypothetical protein